MSQDLLLEKYLDDDVLVLTLNRPDQQNALTIPLLYALSQRVTQNPAKIILLKGQSGVFCTGMDFQEFIAMRQDPDQLSEQASRYTACLQSLRTSSSLIIAVCEGKVMAGGVGLACASDLVFASTTTTFTLTEALWGLLPANVLPYLIQRTNWQFAYRMTLTAQTVSAAEAMTHQLVDGVWSDVALSEKQLLTRLKRLSPSTIAKAKRFFRELPASPEAASDYALKTLRDLLNDETVAHNIENFIKHQQLPWN